MKVSLKDVAELLCFGGVKTEKELLQRIDGQWEYRKNKTVEDVKKAMSKGIKIGMGKTENEIDGIALYLKDVFKEVRKKRN
ncbi:hypothetical protein [Bacillus cereus group sp. TH152-1LC]|uniref:hypothetical protein n=1 Tax=Bacillus cereus group sp. TH152-1LC TaxID=3018060 RepID=UPI0022E876A6|nr:hypothetical protein [Bacillus cereus group sp. TH152-1LC]MDA1675130.1 hypothetical protein [Bacillus cereus group sp. TH152-1LC]